MEGVSDSVLWGIGESIVCCVGTRWQRRKVMMSFPTPQKTTTSQYNNYSIFIFVCHLISWIGSVYVLHPSTNPSN